MHIVRGVFMTGPHLEYMPCSGFNFPLRGNDLAEASWSGFPTPSFTSRLLPVAVVVAQAPAWQVPVVPQFGVVAARPAFPPRSQSVQRFGRTS